MAEELRIRLLGPLVVEGHSPAALGSRKSRTLLKVLALARGSAVAADTLVDILWGEAPPAVPSDQLSVLASRLRAALGVQRLRRSDAGYQLACDWLDVDEAASLLAEASARLAIGSIASSRAAATGCLALHRGRLLADEPDAGWAAAERAAAERVLQDARRVGARAALAGGDPLAAIELAEAVLDDDPCDEPAAQLVMAALVAAGRAPAALQRYEALRERLSSELGVDPGQATRELHLRILREEAGPAAGPPSPPPAPELPGRSAELARLDAALDRAAAGSVQLISLEGEPGMGKTALLDTWLPDAAAGGATVLRGRCEGPAPGLPLQPVLEALQAHLRGLDEAGRAALLAAGGPLLAPLLDWRQRLPEAPPAEAGSQVGQTLLFAALLRVAGRIAAEAEAVLALDDLHLADPATVAWTRFARRQGSGLRLLMIVAQRAEEGHQIEADETLELQPLDLAAVRRVVGDDRAAELHRRSGGNPLFLVELAGAAPAAGLPTSIRETVVARCDRMGVEVAATLRHAAVIGPRLDLELLAAVTRQPAVRLLDHLEVGVRHRILEERGEGFSFRHDLVREALEAGASSTRRALLHREAARSLSSRPRSEPLAAAHHARLGGDLALASSALVEAARLALARFDRGESERLLSEALRLLDSAEGRLARARLRILGGRYEEARDDARAAQASGGGARALEMAGVAAYYLRELAAARDLADEGLGQSGMDAPARAGCLVLAARALHALGDLGEADRRVGEAVEVAGNAGLPAPAVVLGLLRVHQGRATEAVRVLGTGGDGPDASAHLYVSYSPLHARFIRAYALATLGRASEALRELDAAAEEVERLEITRYAGLADAWRGWILRQLGALEEADERSARAATAAARAGYLESEAYAHLDLMEGRLLVADSTGAAARLERAVALEAVEHAYCWRHRLRARWLQARLLLEAGQVEAAAGLADELQTEAARFSASRYQVLGRLLAGRVRAAAGEVVDLAGTAEDLERLDELAGLESWWLTAEQARSFGVDAWWRLAEARVVRLVAAAADRGGALRRYAGTRLERMRTSPRTGSGQGPTAASASSRSS